MTTAETPNQERPTHQAVLDELVALGTDLARRVHAAAPIPGPNPTAADRAAHAAALAAATVAFDRIARAVRRTVRLADHLSRQPEPDPARTAAAATATARIAARKHVIRRVENTLLRAGTPAPEACALRAELLERLDSPAGEFDLAALPVEQVIDAILRDLGLDTAAGPWPRRTPDDLAALHSQAAAPPGSSRAGPATAPAPAKAPAPPDPFAAWLAGLLTTLPADP